MEAVKRHGCALEYASKDLLCVSMSGGMSVAPGELQATDRRGAGGEGIPRIRCCVTAAARAGGPQAGEQGSSCACVCGCRC
eukprot:4073236-Heterocapsa_arctica.AAC.1